MAKKVLITGASSGIGLAVAEQMLALGEEVVGVARDFSKVNLEKLQTVTLDLSDIQNLSRSIVNKCKKNLLSQEFDTLLLNAGYGQFGGLEQFSNEQIIQLVNTNLTANLILLKHLLPMMKKQGGGDVILIGSESALQGAKNGSVYCATKFALRGLAQSLRAECSTKGIRVMLINPGPVRTAFFNDLEFEPKQGDEYALDAHELAKMIMNLIQLPTNTVVEEINLQPIKRVFSKK